MRVAAIDIGTNSVLMLVAEVRDGALVALEDHCEITRLGKGVDRSKRLDDAAIARTLEVLGRYGARARELGAARIAAVATSATRDAENGESFRSAAGERIGGDVKVVTGAREATLTFAGALGGLGLPDGSEVAVIDVGGGSTELILGRTAGVGARAAPRFAHSFDIGSVRLTERHVRNDPPAALELAAVRADADATLAQVPISRALEGAGASLRAAVAIAGTATTFAAIDLGLGNYADAPPHGHVLALERLDAIVQELAAKPHARRCETVGLDPRRADVIVAGGIVLSSCLRAVKMDHLVVSDHGVRWGLAAELAGEDA